MAALPQGDWGEGQGENVSEIRDCYCPNCGISNAVTMMLPTKIPLFREIIVMCLTCKVRISVADRYQDNVRHVAHHLVITLPTGL